jgi:hypothetical protein
MLLLGSDMRNIKSSITRSLCEQISTSPIHWTKATDFSETSGLVASAVLDLLRPRVLKVVVFASSLLATGQR